VQLGAARRSQHPTAELRLEAKEAAAHLVSVRFGTPLAGPFLTATDEGTHGTSQTGKLLV